MLVLSRRVSERILIGDNIWIEVLKVAGSAVRIGISAPPKITVHREEVAERIHKELDHAKR